MPARKQRCSDCTTFAGAAPRGSNARSPTSIQVSSCLLHLSLRHLPLSLPRPLFAFAATAALTLNYCLARHRNGLPTTGEVFSPQDLISCASRQINPRTRVAYGGGVEGASNAAIAAYILDFGITTTGCFPYAQTGRCLEAHPCRTSCVPGSTVAAMTKVKGRGVPDGSRMQAMRFKTEANVAASMQRYV